jgi:hypothetical protein
MTQHLQYLVAMMSVALSIAPAQTTWQQTNGPYGGSVSCLAVSGTNLLAGSYGGGIFRSTNNGTTWTAVNMGLTGPVHVYSLAVIPASGGSGTNIFAGTQFQGVFRSTDNGTTWTGVNNSFGWVRSCFVLSPASGGTGSENLFAGTWGGVFFFRPTTAQAGLRSIPA